MSPRPRPNHQLCLRALASRLEEQLPAGFEVLPEVDVDLELVSPPRPGFVRAPDLVVVSRDTLARVEDGVSLTACQLVGEFGYLHATPLTGAATIAQPFTVRLDLDVLLLKHDPEAAGSG